MPLTSRSRSTARPPMARPSASTGRPASVVSVMREAVGLRRAARRPRAPSRCALSGSSQVPKASTRCGGRAGHDSVGVAEDVRLVGGRRPRHQHLRLRHQQRLEPVALGLQRRRLVARDALRLRPRCARAHQHDGRRPRRTDQPEGQRQRCEYLARRVAATALCARDRRMAQRRRRDESATAQAASANSPRRGRERSLPLAARTVSGIADAPRRERRPPRRPRIVGLYAKRESRRKSPDRERDACGVASTLISAPCAWRAMSSRLMRPSAAENARSASRERRKHHLVEQRRAGSGGSPASSRAPAARRMSSAVMRRALARQLIAAARSADALEDARRAPAPAAPARDDAAAARGARPALGRHRPAPRIERNVDHGGNGKKTLAGQQRHWRDRHPLSRVVIGYGIRAV